MKQSQKIKWVIKLLKLLFLPDRSSRKSSKFSIFGTVSARDSCALSKQIKHPSYEKYVTHSTSTSTASRPALISSFPSPDIVFAGGGFLLSKMKIQVQITAQNNNVTSSFRASIPNLKASKHIATLVLTICSTKHE